MEERQVTAVSAQEQPEASEQATAESVPAQLELAAQTRAGTGEEALKAVVEAIVYVTEEPATPAQIAAALSQPEQSVRRVLAALVEEYSRPNHGVMIREVAGGFQMTTKPEHHEAIRAFVKRLKPPLKLSLAALETLAVIAYKQPITAPEIQAIRGVSGVSALKTLLERKLITTAGRKNVVGRPILYKTTREFLVQFGLKDLSELPTLKEFEELRRLAFADAEPAPEAPQAAGTATAPEQTRASENQE
ncbi:MAG: SMC-Scp complex subunit ScpB [Bryobacteraceae bacterium]